MDTPAAEVKKSIYVSLPIASIQPSKHQARKRFDEEGLKALAESMKMEGLIQPITVRPMGDGYELIGGERRFRAAKLLGWTEIEAKVVKTVSEGESAAKGLIENLQREDLNPMEEAEGYQDLLDMKDGHWSQVQIARAVGRPESRISESLRLIGLPEEVKELLRYRKIDLGHGVEIARLNSPKSKKRLAQKVVQKGLTVLQLRAIIDKKLHKTPTPGNRDRDRGAGTAKDKTGSPGWQFTLQGNQLSVQGLVTLESGEDPVEILFQSLQTAYAAWVTGNTAPAMDTDEDLTPEEALRLIQEAEKLKG